MKVYKIAITEKYKWGCYSNENSVRLLDMISLFSKEKIDIENLPPVKIKINNKENKRLKLADFLFTNIGNIWMVGEKAKTLLEQKYGDFICFFPLDFVDAADLKYFAMFPKEYIEGLDVLKSFSDSESLSTDTAVGLYDINNIDKFVFKEFVKSYPIFRLKKVDYDISLSKTITRCYCRIIFVLDEFVQFVNENGLTGFNFQKVYDDESDIAYEKLPSVPSAPVTGNQQKIKMAHYTGKYKIPFRHENGIYKLSSIEVPEGDGFIFELDGNCILSRKNNYTVYDIGDCNVSKCTEITYWDGKLFSVYINTEKGKLPIYLTFDFSGGKEPETLGRAINECIEVCCNDFINSLEKAEKPLCPVSVEYYYDDEQMSINLQDENSRIYNVGAVARHMVRCICICAGEQCLNNNNMNYETFERILNGLYNRLSEEIPKQFDVTDDFKLYEPEMYD